MHPTMRAALHAGTKWCTRRTWGRVKQEMQERAFKENALVAVTGQGHCTTIGYVLYTSVNTSTVGTVLTIDDLRAEGGTASSDNEFRARWYGVKDTVSGQKIMLPNTKEIYILTFKFYSIIPQ